MCEDHICSGPVGSGAMIPQIAANGEIVQYACCTGDKLPNGGVILDEVVIKGWDHGDNQRESVVLCVTSGVQPFVTWYRIVTTREDRDPDAGPVGRKAVDFCESGHYHTDLDNAVLEFRQRVQRDLDRIKTPPTAWETACEAVREVYRRNVGDELEQDPSDWRWEPIYEDENPMFSTIIFGSLEYIGPAGGGTTFFCAYLNQKRVGERWTLQHLVQYIDGEPMVTEYEHGEISAIR